MRKSFAPVLVALMIVLGILGCSKDKEAQPSVSKQAPSLSEASAEITPIEATTTQGTKVVFRGGEVSWADTVVSLTFGDPAPARSRNPEAALGRPDYRGVDDAEDEGRYVSLGHGGELVLEFKDNVLIDGEGPDLAIFEIGPEVEPILIAISEDGEDWTVDLGRLEGSTCTVDIAPFVRAGQSFRFVRIEDAEGGKSNNSQWPGADVDAVGAINTARPPAPQEGQ
jgi:OOP family OmpA-OmpF porin